MQVRILPPQLLVLYATTISTAQRIIRKGKPIGDGNRLENG